MEVIGWKKSFNSFGHSDFYTLIGHLLTARLGEYGTAVEEIEVTCCLSSADGEPHPTLRDLFKQFQEQVATLPQVSFCRKRRRVKIHFLSERFTAEDEAWKSACLEKRYLAAQEVAAALPLLRHQLQAADDFDVDRFLLDAANALSRKIETDDEWESIRQVAIEKRRMIRSRQDAWDLLGVDWQKFHPHARDILDDTFFWDAANEFSPHGNDTGARLLDEFQQWNERSSRSSPLRFLDGLLHWWDVEPIDWLTVDPTVVAKLYEEQPLQLNACNEIAVGLAFAVMKTRGNCTPEVAQRGRAALIRTAALRNGHTMSSNRRSEWDAAIKKMWAKLESGSISCERPSAETLARA